MAHLAAAQVHNWSLRSIHQHSLPLCEWSSYSQFESQRESQTEWDHLGSRTLHRNKDTQPEHIFLHFSQDPKLLGPQTTTPHCWHKHIIICSNWGHMVQGMYKLRHQTVAACGCTDILLYAQTGGTCCKVKTSDCGSLLAFVSGPTLS